MKKYISQGLNFLGEELNLCWSIFPFLDGSSDLIGRPCCQAHKASDGSNGFSHVDLDNFDVTQEWSAVGKPMYLMDFCPDRKASTSRCLLFSNRARCMQQPYRKSHSPRQVEGREAATLHKAENRVKVS